MGRHLERKRLYSCWGKKKNVKKLQRSGTLFRRMHPRNSGEPQETKKKKRKVRVTKKGAKNTSPVHNKGEIVSNAMAAAEPCVGG